MVCSTPIHLVVCGRARMPMRAKLPEEGRVPCALPQAAGERSRGMGGCNDKVVPGPCQMWTLVAWAAQTLWGAMMGQEEKWSSGSGSLSPPLTPVAHLLTPHCPHTMLDSVCLLHTATVPSCFSSKHGNQDEIFLRAGVLCSGEARSLVQASVSYGQGSWAGLTHGPQFLRNSQDSLELQPHTG